MRLLVSLLLVFSLVAAVPTPREHLGHEAGADNKVADFNAIRTYFEKLAQSSDRIKLEEFGKSANGRPMLVAYISSPENLRQLDRYKQINRRLALGQATAEEAKELVREGKTIVWIDSGLHATEIAPAQHSPELAYRMLTDESDEVRKIRDNVILLQIPVINPDGLDTVAHWFASNVGTEFERAGSPFLYQKYAGHDNNRDWFMMNLAETRAVSKLLFEEWFPQIVYNQHQSAGDGRHQPDRLRHEGTPLARGEDRRHLVSRLRRLVERRLTLRPRLP
jgi:murein tripeptide amidase MpaA